MIHTSSVDGTANVYKWYFAWQKCYLDLLCGESGLVFIGGPVCLTNDQKIIFRERGME
jgi:hypothetical protein